MKVFFWVLVLIGIGAPRVKAEVTDSTQRRVNFLLGFRYWTGIDYYNYGYGHNGNVANGGSTTFSRYEIFPLNIDLGTNIRMGKRFNTQIDVSGFFSKRTNNKSFKFSFSYAPIKNFRCGLGYRHYDYTQKEVVLMDQNIKYYCTQNENATIVSIDLMYKITFKNISCFVVVDLPIAGDGRFALWPDDDRIYITSTGRYPVMQYFRAANISLLFKLL